MDENKHSSGRIQMAVPIRIRGMSSQNKFFDEQTETKLVSENGVITRLRNQIELETEVHLANLKNSLGGTFRVVWVNTHEQDGFHPVGLEALDLEGALWEIALPPGPSNPNAVLARTWLRCRRCQEKVLSAVPEAEEEFLSEGFIVARHCERCKSTTPWEYTQEGEPEMIVEPTPQESVAEPVDAEEKQRREDLRKKGRAPLKMPIKVIRHKYGTTLEDICETANISRNGVLFLSTQNYDVGETVKVIYPYQEEDLTIPVPARVIRAKHVAGSFHNGIAIQLQPEKR